VIEPPTSPQKTLLDHTQEDAVITFNSLLPSRTALAIVALTAAVTYVASGQPSRRASAVSYCLRGVEHHRRGEIDQAMDDFNMALKFDPTYATAYYNRGVAYYDKGDRDSALAYYSRAIELNPRYADALYNRGIVRKEKGDLDGAIADYDRALLLKPRLTVIWNNRGIARKEKGDFDGAIADYSRAIKLDGKLASAWNNRASAWQAKGDPTKALADYDTAIKLDPRYEDHARKIAPSGEGASGRQASLIQPLLEPGNLLNLKSRPRLVPGLQSLV
jgi:tetratricopeptide (TPR) repeat protein